MMTASARAWRTLLLVVFAAVFVCSLGVAPAVAGPAIFSSPVPASGSVVSADTFTASVDYDDIAPVRRYWAKIDGVYVTPTLAVDPGDATKGTISFPASSLADGTHRADVIVYNSSWKLSTYYWVFEVDTAIPPPLTDPAPAPGSTITTAFPDVSVSVGAPLSAFDLSIDGGTIPSSFTGGVLSGQPSTPLENDVTHTALADVTGATGSNSLSWDFFVQVLPKMPDTVGSDCVACHTDYPSPAHLMSDCDACHGAGSPVGMDGLDPSWYEGPDEHPASWIAGLDCISCHGGSYPAIPTIHTNPPADPYHDTTQAICDDCHQRSMTVEHHYRGSGLDCLTCHQSSDSLVRGAVAAWDGNCSTCHPEMIDGGGNVVPHGDYDEIQHTADVASDTVTGTWPSPETGTGLIYTPDYVYAPMCGDCHGMELLPEHEKPSSSSAGGGCSTCHPSPRNTFGAWNEGCTQGGCHAVGSPEEPHTDMTATHDMGTIDVAAGCGFVAGDDRISCHYGDLVTEHNRTLLMREGPQVTKPISVTCADCHSSAEYAALGGTWDGTCVACHAENHNVAGSPRFLEVHALHDNPGGYYDNGSGNTGSNAQDAHGWIRDHPTNPNAATGCGATTCHTRAYLGGGYPFPSAACPSCHGPSIVVPDPFEGDYSWYSGQWYDYEPYTTLMLVETTPTAGSHLRFKVYHDIEEGWDYGYVEASTNGTSWAPLAGNITTNDDPNGANDGNGITGVSSGWVDADFNLSAYAGSSVQLRFRYTCDSWVYGIGWMMDLIEIGPPGGPMVFEDDVETLKPEWTVVDDPGAGQGWTRYSAP